MTVCKRCNGMKMIMNLDSNGKIEELRFMVCPECEERKEK